MSRDWKPGDVAMVTVGGRSGIGVRGGFSWSVALDGYTNTVCDDMRASARPLVVIDPEDPEQVERLTRVLDRHFDGYERPVFRPEDFESMQAALRELANPTPPKPDEPTGLGAVVEDAAGRLWVRHQTKGGGGWYLDGASAPYDDIAAVQVLSEGVQP